jgi:hypothetical protein
VHSQRDAGFCLRSTSAFFCLQTRQVKSRGTGKYVHILSATPELWVMSLRHRTQIVQDLDQSMVVFALGLKPGAWHTAPSALQRLGC